MQFLYMLLVGSFPFNSFLASFIGTLAFFVLTGTLSIHGLQATAVRHAIDHVLAAAVCLRMQLNPANTEFKHMSSERAFADYALSNALLFLVVWNYIG